MSLFGFIFLLSFGHSDWIEVPLDHEDPYSIKVKIEYSIQQPFDSKKKTIITHADPLDDYLGLGDLIELEFTGFNLIKIHGRYSSPYLNQFIEENTGIESDKKYLWLSRGQIIKDIEVVRKEILGDDSAILIGFGSGAGLIHYYLHEFPNNVEKVVSLNPLLLDIPKNLSFWDLLEGFDSIFKEYSTDQIVRFSITSSEPYFFMDKPIRDSLLESRIKEFVKTSFSESQKEISLGLEARAFEHYLDIGIYDLGPFGHFLGLLSSSLRSNTMSLEYFNGTNYDRGKAYSSKIILVGGVYNLLLDPKSFDVIGEFYPNASVHYLRDGYDFSETRKRRIWEALISSLCSDDVSTKIEMFKLLQEHELLFQEKNYNSIRVGK
ncbi:alpha/beta fold hydrolase [Algoriphagus formosus]|uniref:alpha/beta fold hydrolase n=1 Tax=Algoriphagus formosus TaxID=2007308 RepID=UPI000C28F41F|nr:alpha/beta fold hydrolase [Algoriphagus formosus]